MEKNDYYFSSCMICEGLVHYKDNNLEDAIVPAANVCFTKKPLYDKSKCLNIPYKFRHLSKELSKVLQSFE